MSAGAPLTGRERVLLRLPSWLGDFVMSEPLVRAFDERLEPLAGGQLTLAAQGHHLALLEGRFPRARRLDVGRDGSAAWRGHDLAVLCTGSFRSAWQAWRACIPRRAGFARDGRGWLLTDTLRPARERGGLPLGLGRAGRGARYLPRPLERSLAELAGILGLTLRDVRPRLELREPWCEAARRRRAGLGLAPGEPYVLANVGARAGSAKALPSALWSAWLGALGRATGLPVLLACGPGEEPALADVLAGVRGARAVVGPPAELGELAALCAEARLVLTSDSGPRHLARALGVALVCVAGPTDPRHTAGDRACETLVRVAVPCGPCHRERCPQVGAAEKICLTGLEPARLLAAALERLASGEKSRVVSEL